MFIKKNSYHNMSKKLSIITINYNDKKGLQKTIESVISQTWKDFEFIIIDGGSYDGSVEILNQYQTKINHSISEKDTGVYNAMNKGIKIASGDYLIFMNSGDIFVDANVLFKINNKLDFGTSILYGKSNYSKEGIYDRSETPPTKLSFYFFFISGLNHQATFIKRALFFKYFLYNEEYKICSDWEFFIYTICKGNESYEFIDEFICDYDLSGISANPDNQKLYHLERKQSLLKYFPNLINDYSLYHEMNTKRIRNVIKIQKSPIAWKIFKGIINIFLIFTKK